ncbi:MAG TPA: hypothetical protein PLB68_03090 [Candidatus Aminicenantes bacterium]|nr:hypothetical protein [Candidatus Aminicenantes bacterium]
MSENEVKVVWENWLAARRRKAEASWDELFESIADLFRSRGAEMVSHLSPDETGELDNALKVWREEIYKEAKEQADKEAQEAQEAMAKEGASVLTLFSPWNCLANRSTGSFRGRTRTLSSTR